MKNPFSWKTTLVLLISYLIFTGAAMGVAVYTAGNAFHMFATGWWDQFRNVAILGWTLVTNLFVGVGGFVGRVESGLLAKTQRIESVHFELSDTPPRPVSADSARTIRAGWGFSITTKDLTYTSPSSLLNDVIVYYEGLDGRKKVLVERNVLKPTAEALALMKLYRENLKEIAELGIDAEEADSIPLAVFKDAFGTTWKKDRKGKLTSHGKDPSWKVAGFKSAESVAEFRISTYDELAAATRAKADAAEALLKGSPVVNEANNVEAGGEE